MKLTEELRLSRGLDIRSDIGHCQQAFTEALASTMIETADEVNHACVEPGESCFFNKRGQRLRPIGELVRYRQPEVTISIFWIQWSTTSR